MSVRFGLLTLLTTSPMHGYQLRQEFEASTGSTWPLNIGQVYTTLARLARDGLIASSDDGDESQRTYRITGSGREAVAEWFATPVHPGAPPRNELAIKLALAVTRPDVDVRAVIQSQRRATVVALQEYTRARENAGDELSWLLVVDSLIFAAEAEVRWLDHSETRLARHRAPDGDSPLPAPPSGSGRTVAARGGRR
ncbi:MAG: PadR family transcriptional regulator [Acidimicrobiales bacterium]